MAKQEKNKTWAIATGIVIAVLAIIGAAVGVNSNVAVQTTEEGATKIEATIEYSGGHSPAVVESDDGNLELENGELVESDQGNLKIDDDIPTVESVDGGQFEDVEGDGEYEDRGWSENYDTSSIEAFKNATLGKCIIANNVYGAQCVSLVRVYWWGLANRDVSTCGTGAAKGMMLCAEENAGDDFEIHWGADGFGDVAGDVGVWGGGTWGHTAIALGPVYNGHVAVLGENQGGAACAGGGAATNIINLSTNGMVGYYRPKAYIKKAEETHNAENAEEASVVYYTYKKGDYFSKVLVDLGLDEGNLWGEGGTVDYYTKQLVTQNMLELGDTGNVKVGIQFKLEKR